MNVLYDRKFIKKKSKGSLKKHYFMFVVICLLASFLGVNNTIDLQGISFNSMEQQREANLTLDLGASVYDNITRVEHSEGDNPKGLLPQIVKDFQNVKIGPVELGRSKGVLARLVNFFSSGEFILTGYLFFRNLTNSDDIATTILILLGALVVLFATIFFLNTLKVVFARMFLEGMNYDKLPTNRLLYLIKVRKWFKSSISLLVTTIFQFLWDLTIVGGIIKHYSYYMVPYIIAERPDLKPLETISLSRKMMDGHKWQCFVFELSFIGWDILKLFTLGISGILFSTPYQESAKAHYYSYVREEGYNRKVENISKLNDIYLYTKAPVVDLREAYSDIQEIIETERNTELKKETGIRGFIARNFGLVLKYDEQEKAHSDSQERKIAISYYEDIIARNAYPTRISPVREAKKREKLVSLHPMRRYSILSIILFFFFACMVGWLWEVAIHLVEDGVFVNRGTSHGPWLPIYGTGGIMILIFLYRLRKWPVWEFISAVILCGIIEYFTSYMLEVTHNGMKWWDYTGYFLNINGRVCAEGLLIFGLAGLAVVYLLAPVFDNFIRKVSKKILIIVCIILVCSFTADQIFSYYHPNSGKGITDYGTTNSSSSVYSDKLLDVSPDSFLVNRVR